VTPDLPVIAPVVRDCICLERRPGDPHIAECVRRYRAKFFAAWRGVRAGFYGGER
jgi:hypothetical protein